MYTFCFRAIKALTIYTVDCELQYVFFIKFPCIQDESVNLINVLVQTFSAVCEKEHYSMRDLEQRGRERELLVTVQENHISGLLFTSLCGS